MAKKISKLFVLVFMLAALCLSFPIAAQCFQVDTANATAIEGKSGNTYSMTGLVGYKPKHFFVDDNDQSTLINAKASARKEKYYSIVSSGSGESSGWGELSLTPDMKPFVEQGLLYAQATSLVSLSKNEQITLKISSGQDFQQIDASGGLVETPLLKIDDFNQNIRFYFETTSNNFVLDLPTIKLLTQIETVTLEQTSRQVAPGELVRMNAYNDVTKISGVSGNFASFSKINHAIEYEFLSGKDDVEVIGTNIFIKKSAKNGTTVQLRAICNKNSYSTEKINSGDFITFTVNTEISMVDVQVRTDFEAPANFFGVGPTEKDKRITLTVETNKGFEFLGWEVDGVFKTKNRKLTVNAIVGQDIYAKFIKTIQVEAIKIRSRAYNGKTEIDESEAVVSFAGVESGHELTLSGVSYEYEDADVGKNKYVKTSYNSLTLSGKDAGIYSLETDALPQAVGEIDKRDATVICKDASKEYMQSDPTFLFEAENVVTGQVLAGTLSRQSGEAIGKYKINAGTLVERNPNYNLIFEGEAYLQILPRTLSLTNVAVEDKVYDKTNKATATAQLNNVYGNENVQVKLSGEFASVNAGDNIEVRITETELYGKDAANYVVTKYTQPLYGKILPKPITITARNSESVYGDNPQYNFSIEGLVDDETLDNIFTLENTNVGQHEILLSSLNNKNYVVEKFVPATHTITPREVIVLAQAKTKTFGDDDGTIPFVTQNLVVGDSFNGKLSRSEGEDVGRYEILQGDLNNLNYTIKFVSNIFEILPRQIVVNITFLDKDYDGTTSVDYYADFENNIKNEKFTCNLEAVLSSKDCGKVDVQILEKNVDCQNITNYTFAYHVENAQIEIRKRKAGINVLNTSKIYGQADPIFNYEVKNIIGDETLQLNIARRKGENVGQYSFYYMFSGDLNYDLTFTNQTFEILPREMKILVENQSKIFGDEDPIIEYKLIEDFCFDDTAEKVFDGQIRRSVGEDVGVYTYDLSQLSSSANYIFTNAESTNFIITKRPISVSISNATKMYGDDDPVYEYSVSNDIAGQNFEAKISREYGEDVGSYKLFCANLNDPRYVVDYSEGRLTIDPCEITLKADEKMKIYGEADPILTASISKGYLRLNDRLESIISGSPVREKGENVGEYQISLGSLSYGANYHIIFENGLLQILQRHITIYACENSKIYGEADPDFDFTVGGDGLVFDDVVEGKLSRSEGETVGFYDILQGGIHTSKNYYFDFVTSKFEIVKRALQVVPTTLSKQYGEEDVEIEYEIQGKLFGDDTLTGKLYRDTTKNQIGRYQIYSSLYNPNYEISLAINYFTILPRDIVIEAKSFQIVYGQQEPQLSYKIISGSLIAGDEISGDIYRTKGNSVGVYDILSRLTINRNYNIIFLKGTLEILPLSITIQSKDYQKIYGQSDPTFSYEIISGNLINGDQLYGVLFREKGEDVGEYSLVNGVYNANYQITLLPAKLEILKKTVKMVSGVYDKIFDGTTKAHLKNPYISGIIDDVFLEYDRENCAEFERVEVGNHIAVFVHNISIIGEKAGNYNLVLPEDLYANITLPELEKEEVKITAKDAVLQGDFNLNYSSQKLETGQGVQNRKFMYVYNIWLEDNEEIVSPQSLFTIKVGVPQEMLKKDKIFVYQKNQKGEFVLVESEKGEDGKLIITSASLGEIYLAIEDEAWLDWGAFISVIALAVVGILTCISIILKRRKKLKIK